MPDSRIEEVQRILKGFIGHEVEIKLLMDNEAFVTANGVYHNGKSMIVFVATMIEKDGSLRVHSLAQLDCEGL